MKAYLARYIFVVSPTSEVQFTELCNLQFENNSYALR